MFRPEGDSAIEPSWRRPEIPLKLRELVNDSLPLLEMYQWFADHPERAKVEAEILKAKIDQFENPGIVIHDAQGIPHRVRISHETADHLRKIEAETRPHPKVLEILRDGTERALENQPLPQAEVLGQSIYFRNHAAFEGKDAPFEQGVICGHEHDATGTVIQHDPEHPCGDTLLAVNNKNESFEVLLADAMGHGTIGKPVQEFLQFFLRERRLTHPDESLAQSLEAFETYADLIPLYNVDSPQYEFSLLNFTKDGKSDEISVSICQSGNFSLIITKNPDGTFQFIDTHIVCEACESRPLRVYPNLRTPYKQTFQGEFSIIIASDGLDDMTLPDGRLLATVIPEILKDITKKYPPHISAEQFGNIFFRELQKIHTHADSSPTDDVSILHITGSEIRQQLSS